MDATGVVDTRYARIRGREEDGVRRFLGIRYAASPAGELRLRPPVPPERAAGVVEAGEFGPGAPQAGLVPGSGIPGDPDTWDEDCLFLNVWTPAAAPARRPVMVFVHGGGFVTGSGASLLYRGEHLARRGVVVVTLNYRLGALGFLGHPDLAGEAGCANWGLRDQVAALRWVQDNIAAFGGDPANVTVFGESAGAISVCSLIGAPAAAGLFRRAIVQSGPAVAISLEAAATVAELLLAELGIAGGGPAALRSVPLADLLAAQARVGSRFDGGAGLAFQPVVDGGLLPRHPADAVAAGASTGTDLLVGTNRDEFKFFAMTAPELVLLDEDGLAARVRRGLRSAGLERTISAEEAIGAYRAARTARGASTTPFELFAAMASDWLFRVPSIRLVEAHVAAGGRAHCYLFDWETPFAGGFLGACHALELPFVFGTLVDPAIGAFVGDGPEARALADAVQAAWVAYAGAGDPSTPPAGEAGGAALGPWPEYEPAGRSTMMIGPRPGPVAAPLEEERRFWQAQLGRYGIGGPVEGGDPGRATMEIAGVLPAEGT